VKPLDDDALARLRAAAAAGGRYVLAEILGEGGMGRVHVAHDRELDREVALKVLQPTAGDAVDLQERLLQEARILARLEHPGIVPVHDVGTTDDGRVFYTMKRVRGRSLEEVLAGGGSLAELLRVFERVGEAVAFAHARGVVHRDLKPANVMVGEFGEVLVLDWGVAKVLGEAAAEGATLLQRPGAAPPGATLPGTVLGTPGWMAPEQAAGALDRVGPRSDVYALGRILEAMLEAAGRRPRRLAAVVARATHPDPERRYASSEDLVADVRRWRDGEVPRAYAEPWYERIGRFAARHRVALALLLTYLVVRVVLLVWFDV
jgi:serine/threonine protein kinase